ncbi:hypothetical protein BJV77DRAFT_1152736 [Russula vinacea]|nr:hypothetical protein BJV77DRAFT_1152736 [Russula vinacea]
MGRTEVEDALDRLDTLTKEETSMAVTRNLEVTHRVNGNVMAVKGTVHNIDGNVEAIKEVIRVVNDSVEDVISNVDGNIKGTKELAENIDDNVKATKALTEDVGDNVEVIQGIARSVDHNVKRPNMLLRTWLSAPDPSINHNTACKTQHGGTATWFIQSSTFRDWKENGSLFGCREKHPLDATKRNVRGLLTSLLFQLGDDCDRCRDILHQLYTTCRDGSEQPSVAALAGSLKEMLSLPEQLPIFIIVDALDECPNTTGTPSAREEVLDFVECLVGSNHSNLFICVTSRPEQDIQTILGPLAPASRRVSLHEEDGQRKDIDSYIRSFVLNDRECGDGEKKIENSFRWAFCQLDTLRRCLASSIRKALNELPNTLDDTYERALQEIPKEKRRHAYRLFQCLVAAIRPLRVDELALMLAIRFDADRSPSLMEGWRPENPEEVCSPEFLTSDRLETSEVGNICNYHITFDAAHTILAQACLAVLLQLDEKVDEERLETFPLAFYAAEHWVKHAKFEGVALRIQDDMERLFNPHNPYLAAWGHARHPLAKHPSPLNATALYYASLCGFSGVASYIICTHGEDVNALSGYHGTPLRAASYKGHIDVVRVLLDHGANVNTIDKKKTPLTSAYGGRHLEIVRLLLEHGADVDAWDDFDDPVLNGASQNGQAEVVHLLLQHNADVNSRGNFLEVVQLLLEHGADVNSRDDEDRTPYQVAESVGLTEIAQLLLEHRAEKE